MSKPIGFCTFSSQKAKTEQGIALEIIKEVIAEYHGFELIHGLSYQELLGEQPEYAFSGNGKITRINPAWGFLFYRGRLVSILDTVFQSSSSNTVERIFRWLACAHLPNNRIPLDRLFFAFYGPGFDKNDQSHITGQSGAVVELCSKLPVRLLVNPNFAQVEFAFRTMLEEIAGKARFSPHAA